MKEQGEFNDWIRRQVEENSQDPPADTWQHIAEGLELESAWQGINQDLELDNLWTNIDNRLVVHEQISWWSKAGHWMSAATAIVVISLPLLFSLGEMQSDNQLIGLEQLADKTGAIPSNTDNQITTVLEEDADQRSSIDKHSVATKSEVVTADGNDAYGFKPQDSGDAYNGNTANKEGRNRAFAHAQQATLKPANRGLNKDRTATEEKFAGQIHSFHQSSFVQTTIDLNKVFQNAGTNEIPFTTTDSDTDDSFDYLANKKEFSLALPPIHLPEPQQQTLEVAKAPVPIVADKKKQNKGNWLVGAGASARMTWLMNKKTYKALEKSSLTTSLPSFRKSFTLQAENRFSPQLALLTDLVVHNENGQRYEEYQHGVYGKTDTKLVYSGLNLMLGYSARSKTLRQKPFQRLIGGVSAGWLRNATISGPSGESDITNDYKKLSTGLILGYEYNVPLTNLLWLNYGLRAQADLFNIYKGNSEISSAEKTTRATSLDFIIGLRYDFKKN